MSGITRGHSCILCQKRKVRCDKLKPCSNCVKAKAECTVIPQRPRGKRGVPRPQAKDMMERLKKYEELMIKHGIDFDLISDVGHVTGEFEAPVASNPSHESRRSNETNDRKWFAYHDDYQATDEMLQGSSEEESDRPKAHHAFDAMFNETIGFPFVAGSSQTNKTTSYPSSIHSIQLWQIYINNVNPLLRINHVPTLQSQVIEASTDIANVQKPLQALVFGICLTAVNSVADDEVQSKFGENKSTLILRFRENTQQALLDAGFMKSSDIMVLQAYFLYLIGLRPYVDPRSLFCLIGIAVRIATRIGLHRDGAQFRLSPFDIEQRRRLWWQIVTLDKRIADITGSPTSALSSTGIDCRFPLNVNDTDLHPHAKEPPVPVAGVTEMTFALTRIEITLASAPNGIRPNPKIPDDFQENDGPPSASVGKTTAQTQSGHLNRYCAYMESTYLKQCDTRIPVHLFTLLMTRVSLRKLRVLDFVCRDASCTESGTERRDTSFLAAIELLEADNETNQTESLRGFLWYTSMQIPLPGYMFLTNELRHRTDGGLCQRAWEAIAQSPYYRGLGCNLRSPLHVGLARAILEAWDARQNAEMEQGRTLQQPDLVTALRASLASHVAKKAPVQSRTAGFGEGNGISASNFESRQIDDTANMVFSGDSAYNPIGYMDEIAPSVELDYNQMAWSSLMESGAIGGFWGNLH